MENKSPGRSPSPPPANRPRFNAWTLILLFAMSVIILLYFSQKPGDTSTIEYSFFRKMLGEPDKNGKPTETHIKSVEFRGQQLVGEFTDPPPLDPKATKEQLKAAGKNPPRLHERFVTVLPPAVLATDDLNRTLLAQDVQVDAKVPSDSSGWMFMFSILMTVALFGVIFMLYRRAQSQMMGGGFLGGFSKSPAKKYDATKPPVTFNDVAGLENVKNDLEEIVEYLKNPEKFQRLGGRIPKGTLLVGPPGTGKTLMARAMAGEAGVPFYSINGSEFIQMFVGVGASRVRDMFQTVRENSPCILFIDEIDAVGRIRGAGLGGGHDEREQTLNQILSEMDGFTPDEAVIVVAATNRPDVLDPALLRPGRFDRHVTVDRPNLKGRVGLFKVHTRDVPLDDDVDMDALARGTVGLTGADVRNIVNEAALWAAREGKDKVSMSDFDYATDKVLMGAKREEVLSGREKKLTAYHESGHALLAWIVPGADRVHKVTIIPRGRMLGGTQIVPEEDRLNVGENDLTAKLIYILGGRAAEKLVFDEFSAGAENDLKRATQLARRMVTAWGMSERLGPVNYQTSEEHPFLGKEIHEQRQFSEHTAQVIDEEVVRILHGAADRAHSLLEENRELLDKLTTLLEEKEVLDEHEIEEVLGPSPNFTPSRNGRPVEFAPDRESDDAKPVGQSKTNPNKSTD